MASREALGSRTCSWCARVALLTVALIAVGETGRAQVVTPSALMKWTLSVSSGRTQRASMADLEAQLNAARLGGTAWGKYPPIVRPICCQVGRTVSVTYPVVTRRGSRWQIAASYAYRRKLGFRVQLSTADVAAARGYHPEGQITDPPSIFGEPGPEHTYGALYSQKQAAKGVAFLPVVALGWLRVGIGPELSRLEISHYSLADSAGWTDRIESQVRERKSLVGGIAHGALIIGAKSLVYVELAAQYHFVPSVKSAPFDVRGSSGSVVTTVPSGEVQSSRFVRMLGVGLRF